MQKEVADESFKQGVSPSVFDPSNIVINVSNLGSFKQGVSPSVFDHKIFLPDVCNNWSVSNRA